MSDAAQSNGSATADDPTAAAEALAASIRDQHAQAPGPGDADGKQDDPDAEGGSAPENVEDDGGPSSAVETDDEPEADPDQADDADDADAEDAEPVRLGIRALTNEQFVALRRGQIPDAVIDALSDEQLKALADTEAEKERRTKEHFESLSAKGSDRKEGSAADAEGGDEPAASPTPPEPADKSASRGLPEPVLDDLGLSDEGVKSLEKWHQGEIASVRTEAAQLVAQAQKESREQLQAMQNEMKMAQGLALYQASESARASIRDEYPEAGLLPEWNKAWARAIAILPGFEGDIPTRLQQALPVAAMMEWGEPKSKREGGNAKRATKPATTERRSKPAKPKQSGPRASKTEDLEVLARKIARKHGIDPKTGSRRRW